MLAVLALGAFERVVNRWIDLDVATRQAFDSLAGQVLRVVIASPQLSVDVFFDTGKIRFSPTILNDAKYGNTPKVSSVFEQRPYDVVNAPFKANTTLTVDNLISLVSLATRAPTAGGNLPLSGDLALMQKVQLILAMAEPDLAYRLSPILGDVLAEQLANGLKQLKSHAQKASQSALDYGTEFLKEDSQLFASRWQAEKFVSGVQTLSVNLERADAKLKQLEAHFSK